MGVSLTFFDWKYNFKKYFYGWWVTWERERGITVQPWLLDSLFEPRTKFLISSRMMDYVSFGKLHSCSWALDKSWTTESWNLQYLAKTWSCDILGCSLKPNPNALAISRAKVKIMIFLLKLGRLTRRVVWTEPQQNQNHPQETSLKLLWLIDEQERLRTLNFCGMEQIILDYKILKEDNIHFPPKS